MQTPKFYRERAQVAEKLAKLFRDETAEQMMKRAAERWRELVRLAAPTSDNQQRQMGQSAQDHTSPASPRRQHQRRKNARALSASWPRKRSRAANKTKTSST